MEQCRDGGGMRRDGAWSGTNDPENSICLHAPKIRVGGGSRTPIPARLWSTRSVRSCAVRSTSVGGEQ
jgi:hypothetical protein